MKNQKTITKQINLQGKGIHSGKNVRLSFRPADTDTGIFFKRIDLKNQPVIRCSALNFGSQDRRTTIEENGFQVNTIEHLMAALWALEIDNVEVDIDAEELPALDGSSKDFFDALERAGIKEQGKKREIITIKNPIWYDHGESFIGVFPSKAFKVSYVLEENIESIKRQAYSKEVDKKIFYEEIAPARTFCLKKEAELLLKMGYGKGADFSNTLIMDETGPVQSTLRFKDEPVRHKVLDLLGDLYILNRPLVGRVIGIRSGHKLNAELVKKIGTEYLK